MAIDLDKYMKLKKKCEQSRTEVARAEGVLQEQKAKLKADFGVDTIEEADKLLAEITKQKTDAENSYNEELKKFEEKWGVLK